MRSNRYFLSVVKMKTRLYISLFAIYFLRVYSQDETLNLKNESSVENFDDTDENAILKFKIITENRKFHMNLTSLLSRSNSIAIVDNSSDKTDGFLNDFIRRLHRYGVNASIINFDVSVMKNCKNCDLTKIQMELQKQISYKQIVFVIYDNDESFKTSTQDQWSIFEKSPRSFFIIVMTDIILRGTDCKAADFEDSLKNVAIDLFEINWLNYKVFESVLYYPKLCGVERILKYDPLMEKSDHLRIRYLTEEELNNDANILLHEKNNLRGYPLKVKLFGRIPTSVKNLSQSILNSYLQKDIESIGNIGGIDGFALANLVKYLNFTVDVSEPADGIEYGYMHNNGTYMGTLGDVIYKRADISFNARFLKNYDAKDIEFTYPIYHDQFCVLVPKALIIPTWRNIFLGFSATAWYAIIITASISGVLWWVMKAKSTHPEPESGGYMGFCIHFMDACLLIASQPIFLPSLQRERIFIAGCLIFNIIFSGVFQGYLNTAFSTTSHYPDINTLDALDKSGLPIATSSRLNDIFGSGSLQKKIKSLKTAAIDQAAEKRDVSAVERRSDAHLLIELKYLAKDGEPLLHVVNECPQSYYLSYMVYKGYPFLPHINRFIRRAIEGGLNEQWYDFTIYSIILHHRSQHQISSESLKKLTLVDVQTAFFALFIGLVSSSIVFVFELVHHRIVENKKCKRKIWKRKIQSNLFYIPMTVPKYEFTL